MVDSFSDGLQQDLTHMNGSQCNKQPEALPCNALEVGTIAQAQSNIDDLYKSSNLTNSQLQIWMGQNLLPEIPIYNLAVALSLHGEIDPAHFRRAFQTLVNSSDALRTVLEEINGIPMRQVLPALTYETAIVDLSAQPDSRSAAKSWIERRCKLALSFQQCLFDSALLKLSNNEFVWYLNVHHLVCDGWSFELIYRQMGELYRRSLLGQLREPLNLLRYEDYVAYERRQYNSVRYQRSEAYWKQLIEDRGDEISFYGNTGGKTTCSVRRCSWDLGVERTRKLRSLGAGQGSETENSSLLQNFAAILITYLHCLNGKSRYTIGIPFHNRRSKSFKETIGFFSEVLPIRVEVEDEDTFISLIDKVKSEVFRAVRHGQYSLLNPYHNRVYEVVLNYHTTAFSNFAGMSAFPEWVHNGHGDDSLAIQIRDFASSESLCVDFDLHQEVFAEKDLERVVTHFSRVVDEFLAAPERPLRLVSLVSPEDVKKIVEAHDSGSEPMETSCIHQLIEKRAQKQPDAIAVVRENDHLSYDELNRRANRVAHHLRKRGVGPDMLVGLYVERSLDMVVGILGVLKAGAAYVPIPSEYPEEWVRFVLKDTGCPILLTQEELSLNLPRHEAEVVVLGGDWIDDESDENLGLCTDGDNLAYVIYTSGSTGVPKGVQVTHRGLTNFVLQAAGLFGLGPNDRVLQFASIGFDTSVEEIFPCLMRGATLVLRTDAMPDSVAAFVQKCEDWRLTVLDLPTAYWHELTTTLVSERWVFPPSVRLVIIGGERAIPEKLALWHACVSYRVKLLNTYGPTETTVAATVYDLTDHPSGNGSLGEIPIGSPILNVQTYVLDQNLLPVPVGVSGELYVGGLGVARGYLNQPELTDERFPLNPFSEDRNARFFRTGDRVRYRPDGNLEFLGRIDRQVKIRGYRVELDGIEAALRKHPLITDSAVVLDGDRSPQRLIAFVVPRQGAVLNPADVKHFASKKLPQYMVPATIVALEALPLNRRGKVDLRKLPVPDASLQQSRTIVPPETAMESTIAALWREVLGLKEVGRWDHFFELGGHSLLAAQVISRIRKDLNVEISLRVIFEAPTLAELAERVDEALRDTAGRVEPARILQLTHGDRVPVSPSQARIWYMHQLAPESAAYNIAAPVRFTGYLRKNALIRSLDEMVRRHESLRTTFQVSEGRPVQVISPSLHLEIPEVDLRNVPENLRVAEAKRILGEEALRPFDLENGPLLRVNLLRLGDEDHVLLVNMHHVISDQWSMSVIAREVTSLYNGFCNTESLTTNGSHPQYSDFAIWQEDGVGREDLAEQLAFWKTRLVDMEPLALLTDYPRPPVQTFRGARQSLDIPVSLVNRLKSEAARENATLYMIFLAAFKLLLYRYSGQTDIAIGSPVANRTRLEWEEVIGTFINLLVLRTDLSGNPAFRQVLQRVRHVVLDAFTHGDVSFEVLVREIQSVRDPSRSPLIHVLFNFQSTPTSHIDLQDLSWMPFEIDQVSPQFDLSVTIDTEITRKIVVVYNTDLYREDTITRMLLHYRRLLEAVAENPDCSIDALSILTDGERCQLLREWNDNDIVHPQGSVHGLVEAQARKTPDSVAAVFEGQQLTYKELDQRANRVAYRLRAMGVKSEALVGICMERSLELLIGLLAILKAGGAYVPIDPAYPAERIAFMIEDSGATVLLTQEKVLRHLPETTCSTLCVESVAEMTKFDHREKLVPVSPSNLAYVIYTSGSTGKPKGVAVEHKSIVNFLHSMRRTPGIDERDVLLSVTTVSFDIAALELFLPLTVGASVVIASRETAADGRRLRQSIEDSGATMMQATPTTWRILTEAGWKGAAHFKVLCGGEQFPVDLAESLLDGRNQVWNLYGPTETTVWSTVCQIGPGQSNISIGRPIDNTNVYILDANKEPVPIGVAGELYIGGHGVARGYWNRPELTAEKFIRDSFSKETEARCFKTGDLARYLPDGNIECHGRMDQQLKIRGHRIEPGEIEAVLREHPGVEQAVIVGVANTIGELRLVAYVVTRPNIRADQNALREFLRAQLPEYMVPSVFIPLENIPITPGGKVNRRALPLPNANGVHSTDRFIAPRDRLEFQLAQIWQSVLNVNRIGIQDNFFELGGHSLTSVKLISEISKCLGMDLPLSTIFRAPTVEQLAKIVRTEGWAPPRNCLTEIRASGSKPPIFIVSGGYSLPVIPDLEHPVYGLSLLGMFDKQITGTTVKAIATNYFQSIRSVQPSGPYYIVGHSSGGTVAYEMARLLDSEGEKVALLALLDTYGPQSKRSSRLATIKAHWSAYKRRAPKDRLSYIAFVLDKLANIVRIPLRRMIWLTLHPSFLSGGPVPLNAKNLSMAYDLAFRGHKIEPYHGSVVLLRAEETKPGFHNDTDRGWGAMISGGLEIYEVPGDHLSMLDGPNAQIVANRLGECLRVAQLDNKRELTRPTSVVGKPIQSLEFGTAMPQLNCQSSAKDLL